VEAAVPVEQRLAVPAYFRGAEAWDALGAAAPTLDLAVLNPASGPGDGPDPGYLAWVGRGQQRGVAVLGYVSTRYSARARDEVEREIDAYFEWYAVDGIFVDEASPSCDDLPYYAALRRLIRRHDRGARVVLNPGRQTEQCYMAVADVLVTAEMAYRDYVDRYRAPGWVRRYDPRRFWHLVHAASGRDEMARAVELSRERRAGRVYVTSGGLPNPWGSLPSADYWAAEVEAVRR
jgi:hypothetical protein